MFVIEYSVCHWEAFHPGLKLWVRPGAYPGVERVGYGLTRKHKTRLARDKHSSLLQVLLNYGCKKFYNIGTRKDYPSLTLQDLALMWDRSHTWSGDKWNPKRSGLSFARL